MKKRNRSILEELNLIVPEKNKLDIVESRANHIIESAINLLKLINESFPIEHAEELEKRFYSSLKNTDPKRFERSIKKLRSKQTTQEKQDD